MVPQCCGTWGMRAHPHSDPTRAYRWVVFQPQDIHSARKQKWLRARPQPVPTRCVSQLKHVLMPGTQREAV
ncbi:hypothetical protein HETIRDRAFT_142519 [Heterobasidion irregulare TC 32-1]|uniref:Uncharacterized protein n=1 Tax=Heterobasidion irregulare (strain TC 32-1) TaxID=747525 RepID=W4KG61_HETIT|nr:uncharacterized protein HETIRDRAFT_142519 [Heterobasidion irregulare TC 32-1]ETW84724.1 hypothetical protein HETIRDRAFT_142519 [Heterobasidion irregulare TC 32-1]